jgi:hypothetical protein
LRRSVSNPHGAHKGQIDDEGHSTQDLQTGSVFIWASSTLNFAKWNLDVLIAKIYETVKPRGYFLSFQDGMTHEHTKPDTMPGHLADQLTTGDDFSWIRAPWPMRPCG